MLRTELPDTNIGITCVHPGGIKTNIATNVRQIEWLTRLFPTRYVRLMRRQIEKAFETEG